MKEFDDTWRRWIKQNLQEGCSKDVLFKILHDSGFAFDAIRSELGHEPTLPLRVIFGPNSVWDGAALEPQPQGNGNGSSFVDALEPGSSIDAPEWIRKSTLEQQTRVPHLGAGGPACRGFEKRRMDEDVFAEVRALFESVRHRFAEEKSEAIGGFLCTAHDTLPPALFHEEPEFKPVLMELLRPMHEAWCGFELEPASCYGFRVYLHGAYLHEHVDRQDSHIVSSSLCVDRELYAPWLLGIEDIDGVRHEVDLAPGEHVLYESSRVAHGRPVPMNGRYHVGLFIHYRPARDWDLWLESPMAWWAKHGRPDLG